MDGPEKLEFGQWFDDRSHPVWHYRALPEGLHRARLHEMYHGRPCVFEVLTGPHKGEYYTAFYSGQSAVALKWRILHDYPVYVK